MLSIYFNAAAVNVIMSAYLICVLRVISCLIRCFSLGSLLFR